MVHLSKAHYKPDEPDSEYKWTEYQCLLVTLCHVPWLGKKASKSSSCDLTSASFADDWKSNERETRSCLWHPVGMPPGFTKQTGNGRVRLSLVRPSSSGTACARTYVPLICGWGVGATHHPEKGVCAHTHAWACAGKIRGGHMCRQCRASGVRRRQPGLFQVQL